MKMKPNKYTFLIYCCLFFIILCASSVFFIKQENEKIIARAILVKKEKDKKEKMKKDDENELKSIEAKRKEAISREIEISLKREQKTREEIEEYERNYENNFNAYYNTRSSSQMTNPYSACKQNDIQILERLREFEAEMENCRPEIQNCMIKYNAAIIKHGRTDVFVTPYRWNLIDALNKVVRLSSRAMYCSDQLNNEEYRNSLHNKYEQIYNYYNNLSMSIHEEGMPR